MSGFAVAKGSPKRDCVERMIKKISHRGKYLSGLVENRDVIMAQNYLRADVNTGFKGLDVPVTAALNMDLHICYDGQITDRSIMARFGCDILAAGEEKTFLALYQEYGTEMLEHLTDGIFSFVISDGGGFFAARDLLGIKTLFWGEKNGTLYLASELKSILEVTDEVYEFPPGHYTTGNGEFTRFARLPSSPPQMIQKDIKGICDDVKNLIQGAVADTVDFCRPTAALLSGGMDSSVIAMLSSRILKEKDGKAARLKTFSIGVGESSDIIAAREMARHIGSEHQELIVTLEDVLDALPKVIYYLENFDPSLVRSSVSNYLISRRAAEQGIEILLSGEGGDEVFGGYLYLKSTPAEEFFHKQIECLEFLHNNASLRLDRMNQCNSVKVVAPLISAKLLNYALALPAEFKQKPEGDGKIEKWIFRKTFEKDLPESITWRLKQEFSQGSGSAGVLPEYFEKTISDSDYHEAKKPYPVIRSKEEYYYFKLFTSYFGDGSAVETVGQWISL